MIQFRVLDIATSNYTKRFIIISYIAICWGYYSEQAGPAEDLKTVVELPFDDLMGTIPSDGDRGNLKTLVSV